jgi:GTPase SAR1 family protein
VERLIKVDGSNFMVKLRSIAFEREDEQKVATIEEYIKLSCAFIFVFDVARKDTLDQLQQFVALIQRVKGSQGFPVALCGQKCSKKSEYFEDVVQEAYSFKKQYLNDCPFYYTIIRQSTEIVIRTLLVEIRGKLTEPVPKKGRKNILSLLSRMKKKKKATKNH